VHGHRVLTFPASLPGIRNSGTTPLCRDDDTTSAVASVSGYGLRSAGCRLPATG
jgi:hypothetical protein